MDESINIQQQDGNAATSEFRVRLEDVSELTRGSGSGSSEDKRYVYN